MDRPQGPSRPGSPPEVTFVILAAVILAASTLDAPLSVVRATHATSAIRIDGRLDEEAWKGAGLIEDLTQQSPVSGGVHPFRTEVRFLLDGDTLYVGFLCRDPEPSRIALHTMQRDGNMDGDDSVAVLLDTFGDRRNGYLFRVNAAGARLDGLISGPETFSTDWDGLWDAAATRTPEGWSVEIALPAATLRFRPGQPWGLNVERYVARDQMSLRWTGTTLDSKLWDMSRAGRLEGVEGLKQGLGISAVPYVLGQRLQSFTPPDPNLVWKGTGGFDLSWNPSADLGGVLTVNTDFAETEVDTRQINLTRFPLFFPEKRAFFLESSNLFTFGLGLETTFIPFYSRRVGLLEGETIPIDAGLKVMARAGSFSLAALDVETRKTDLSDRANLFTGRATYDVDEHLRVGLIGTNGEPTGRSENWLLGLDAVWKTSTFLGDRNLAFGLWGAASGGDLPSGKRGGWGLKADYPNDLWDVFLIVNEFGDALSPALGFLPRPGTRQWSAGLSYQPRPGPGTFGWVRQFYFVVEPSLVTGLDGTTQSWEVFLSPINFVTQSGDHVEVDVMPQFEHLFAPFTISSGVVIPPGSYPFTRGTFLVESSKHRALALSGSVTFGGFYSGHLTSYQASATWTGPGGHVTLAFAGRYNDGRLPEGRFIQRLWQPQAVYAFNPDLVLSAYLQYDSESRNLGSNTRLRWTIRPGCEAFLVWNRAWQSPPGAPLSQLPPESDQIVAKLRWTFRW